MNLIIVIGNYQFILKPIDYQNVKKLDSTFQTAVNEFLIEHLNIIHLKNMIERVNENLKN